MASPVRSWLLWLATPVANGRVRGVTASIVVALAACSGGGASEGEHCAILADCADGLQCLDHTCVPACLRMVFAAHGKHLEEQEIFYECGRDKTGVTASAAIGAAVGFGFRSSRREFLHDVAELEVELNQGLFPIVFLRSIPAGPLPDDHAVVVVVVADAGVLVYDPARRYNGPRTLLLDEFISMWRAARGVTVVVAP